MVALAVLAAPRRVQSRRSSRSALPPDVHAVVCLRVQTVSWRL